MKKKRQVFLVSLLSILFSLMVFTPLYGYNNIESSSRPQGEKTIAMLDEKEDDIKVEIDNLKEALKVQLEWTNERLRIITKIYLLEKSTLILKKKSLESLKRLKEILETRKKRIKIE